MILGACIHLLACFTILYTESFKVALAMTFFTGFAMAGRALVTYVWFTEFMPKSAVPKATAFTFGIDSSVLAWFSLYFNYVSKEWTYIYAVPLVVLAATTLYVLVYMPDSPRYYFA